MTSSIAHVSQASTIPTIIAVSRPTTTCRGYRRRWLVGLLLAIVLAPALLALPPVWHGALRTFLIWQASRGGYDLTITRIGGGVFEVTHLEGVRLRQRDASAEAGGHGTDLHVESARFAVSWRLPWSQRSAPTMREVQLDGVSGCLDLTADALTRGASQHDLFHAASQHLPADFAVQADDLRVRRGSCTLRAVNFLLSGKQDAAGEIVVGGLRVEGPGFASVFTGCHGRTFWKGDRLTLTAMDLGNGITLSNATLDASRLGRRRLDWDCSLSAFGGEIRGQGGVDFARVSVAVEIAATLHGISLAPLVQTVGIHEPIDGQVEQACVTFRGDPENLSAAQMWFSVLATDFQWGERRWESLDTQAVVMNRCVQLHRFELRQYENRLSLAGEFPLPRVGISELVRTGEASWWHAAGFSLGIDARLGDLHALAELAGPGIPDLAGRMSVNGQLASAPGRAEIEGYLNVEGTRMTIRGAPLDFLHSTLLFRGGAMEVADVQATHDADYFTAHGVVGLSGERATRRGELRAEVKDVGVYALALAGLTGIGERVANVRHIDVVLRWEDGELFLDRWDGEQAGFLLAR